MLFCTACGTKRVGEFRFCVSCGAMFDVGQGAPLSHLGNVLRMSDERTAPASGLIAVASGDPGDARDSVTKAIIDAMDTVAMKACGDAALARGDMVRAEFWFMEVATADADEGIRADGIEDLARKVYIPLGRAYEAALYSMHAARHPDAGPRARAERTLTDIKAIRAAQAPDGLDFDDGWRKVDLRRPAAAGMTQREHYLRLVAYLFHQDGEGELKKLVSALQTDFMPSVTGLIIGASKDAESLGRARETSVKATADWLAHRDGWRFPSRESLHRL